MTDTIPGTTTGVPVAETAGVRQQLGRFHLSGTGDLVYETYNGTPYIISNQPLMQPLVDSLTYAKEQGVGPALPSYLTLKQQVDLYESLAHALYTVGEQAKLVAEEQAHTRAVQEKLSLVAAERHTELEQYKNEVRNALLEAWEGHKGHITRHDLNQFLESIDLDTIGVCVRKATVRVWAYQDVEVEDLDVDDEDEVEGAVKENAQENTDRYSWEVDSDKTEVQDEIDMYS